MKKAVLIIYTGGTIGMINDPETGVLCPFNFDQIANTTPEIKELGFRIDSHTLPELIDSSNLKPGLWNELCRIILDNYDKYCGFVILHGTDTMAYSASALSFMLENLNKPVVFTGSQLPIGKIRTDGRENLITSLEIAAAYENGKAIVPEVSILFGDKLLRGNRTTKFDAEGFNAFQSFNYPSLAEIGIHIQYNTNAISQAKTEGKITASTDMNTNIAILKIFPGIKHEVVKAIVEIPGLQGIILECYGSGNAPTDPSFIELLKKASAKNMIIYNVTQCQDGSVEMGRYETSCELIKAGVTGGYDITTEAAVCKMMYLLGKYKDPEKIKKHLNSELKGELTKTIVGL